MEREVGARTVPVPFSAVDISNNVQAVVALLSNEQLYKEYGYMVVDIINECTKRLLKNYESF